MVDPVTEGNEAIAKTVGATIEGAKVDPEMDRGEAMVRATADRVEIGDRGDGKAGPPASNRILKEATARGAGDANHNRKVEVLNPHLNFRTLVPK